MGIFSFGFTLTCILHDAVVHKCCMLRSNYRFLKIGMSERNEMKVHNHNVNINIKIAKQAEL